ncbi:MAG TPA: hypothetical protein VFF73_35365 [Planctomycetota bacterium]|nr:hypothetical protein [Planctomycetota bacterium]
MVRLVFVVALGLAVPALAQDAWKWDPHGRRAAAVGDRFFQVEEMSQEIKSKTTSTKNGVQDEDEVAEIKFRIVHEVLAVEGTEVTKERVSIERWSYASKRGGKLEEEDKSATGRAVIVEVKDGARTVTFEGDTTGLTEHAKKWAKDTLSRADQMDQVDKLFPKGPVKPDEEWTIDPTALASEMFEKAKIDAEKSKCTGKLTQVKEEDGVHTGEVAIKTAIQLKQVPGTDPIDWKEGGLVDMSVNMKGSLELEKSRDRSFQLDLKLKGRAEQEDKKKDKVSVEMEMSMKVSFKMGDMPKK